MGGGGAVRLESLKKAAAKGAEQPHEPSQALVPTRALLHGSLRQLELSNACAQPLAMSSECLLCLHALPSLVLRVIIATWVVHVAGRERPSGEAARPWCSSNTAGWGNGGYGAGPGYGCRSGQWRPPGERGGPAQARGCACGRCAGRLPFCLHSALCSRSSLSPGAT